MPTNTIVEPWLQQNGADAPDRRHLRIDHMAALRKLGKKHGRGLCDSTTFTGTLQLYFLHALLDTQQSIVERLERTNRLDEANLEGALRDAADALQQTYIEALSASARKLQARRDFRIDGDIAHANRLCAPLATRTLDYARHAAGLPLQPAQDQNAALDEIRFMAKAHGWLTRQWNIPDDRCQAELACLYRARPAERETTRLWHLAYQQARQYGIEEWEARNQAAQRTLEKMHTGSEAYTSSNPNRLPPLARIHNKPGPHASDTAAMTAVNRETRTARPFQPVGNHVLTPRAR